MGCGVVTGFEVGILNEGLGKRQKECRNREWDLVGNTGPSRLSLDVY